MKSIFDEIDYDDEFIQSLIKNDNQEENKKNDVDYSTNYQIRKNTMLENILKTKSYHFFVNEIQDENIYLNTVQIRKFINSVIGLGKLKIYKVKSSNSNILSMFRYFDNYFDIIVSAYRDHKNDIIYYMYNSSKNDSRIRNLTKQINKHNDEIELLRKLEIEKSIYPNIYYPNEIAGYITEEASK